MFYNRYQVTDFLSPRPAASGFRYHKSASLKRCGFDMITYDMDQYCFVSRMPPTCLVASQMGSKTNYLAIGASRTCPHGRHKVVTTTSTLFILTARNCCMGSPWSYHGITMGLTCYHLSNKSIQFHEVQPKSFCQSLLMRQGDSLSHGYGGPSAVSYRK